MMCQAVMFGGSMQAGDTFKDLIAQTSVVDTTSLAALKLAALKKWAAGNIYDIVHSGRKSSFTLE